MKDVLRQLWVVVAIALVVPTTTLDLQMLFGGTDPGTRARDVEPIRLASAPPLQYNLCPGDAQAFSFEVYLPPAPLQADILFAFDTTGSMDSVIATAQDRAIEIMSNLQTLITDVRFGVVDFRDYPTPPYGDPDDWPYRLRQPLTNDIAAMQRGIEALASGGGGDVYEAYTRVLYEAYADQNIDWRPEARRFIVMFGDSVAHDDDLNAGVPSPQPYSPDEAWQTGSYPPPHLDVGRDGRNGTEDDLDFQPVLNSLHDHSITLLFVVSGISHYLKIMGLTTRGLLIYWQTWADMTGPGGGARILQDVDELPATIQALVTAAVRHIDRLTVYVAPSWFAEWVTIVPPTYENPDIPAEGLYRNFEVTATVPRHVPAGHYIFDLVAEADGTVYQRQQVEITVPEGCFATPTPTWALPPTPRPRRLLYMPFIASNFANWQP